MQSSLDGFNVCIFAYGQTGEEGCAKAYAVKKVNKGNLECAGSGKTHTMTGGSSPSEEGMIPRALEKASSNQACVLVSQSGPASVTLDGLVWFGFDYEVG